MNEDIINIGVKLIKHIASRQQVGVENEQISQRLSDDLFNFKELLLSQTTGVAEIFSNIILKASEEIDAKRLRNAESFLALYIDPNWNEESKVRVTEAQIKSDTVNSVAEKASIATVATVAIGALGWIIKTIIDNKTKPKKFWEK
ncbi:hypothetical protein [Acidithiobacillus acidisediminis]|uniref:hypothetical protein n=1 Tax=Acidithiobacillus acidisediminis TaxID=2937799 RepID=UPI00200BBC98|nr:hypothetical protein [Acidithiobacillus sp. S30A2]